jgi:hypothetical protein
LTTDRELRPVIEAARVLSKHKFPGTIVYAALSGEEQGLLGGKILADHAKAKGWNVIANLNNDIIGNSCGSDGVCNDKVVRVFSEGPRWQGHEELASQIRSLGGENDSPSRNISRWLDGLADRLDIGLDVMQVWRNDRFGARWRSHRIPQRGVSRRPSFGRGRELQLAAPGPAHRQGHRIRRHDREHGLPLPTEDHEAERRRACRSCQRASSARDRGRRSGVQRHDFELGSPLSPSAYKFCRRRTDATLEVGSSNAENVSSWLRTCGRCLMTPGS